jgi:hypothetical protein
MSRFTVLRALVLAAGLSVPLAQATLAQQEQQTQPEQQSMAPGQSAAPSGNTYGSPYYGNQFTPGD